MIYHALPNLVTSEVTPLTKAPDAACARAVAAIPASVQSKAERRSWLSKTTTKHVILSSYEGLNAGMRINPKMGQSPLEDARADRGL